MSFLIRLVLLALAFQFLLPMIPGIQVHGGFVTSLGLALMFSVLGWIVSWVAALITAFLAVGTLGLALLVLIPLWLVGFWLLPAYTLMLTSDVMPTYLQVAGWTPAIMGGLLTLVIGIVTDSDNFKRKTTVVERV
ncbi:MAG: phage holin family protein [Candidatus Melainabacteria bacterium]|nr:phage holin family protein [Candidatus Melainabacteria bacterium]